MFEPQWNLDGAAVVEWAARQRWSDGRVGMFGISAPGISQLGVASVRPPHLRAIAPFQYLTDFYRDGVYPGGIENISFPPGWALGIQPANSTTGAATSIAAGDDVCIARVAARQRGNLASNAAFHVGEHPFDDDYYGDRNPRAVLGAIEVPALTCTSWQDDALGSRGGFNGIDGLKPGRTWSIGTNGYHGVCGDPVFTSYLVRFFDRFVRGVRNGFEATPHVTLFHETHPDGYPRIPPGNGSVPEPGPHVVSVPSWITTHASWPVRVAPIGLHLGEGGALTTAKTVVTGSDRYLAPLPAPSTVEGYKVGNTGAAWKVPGAVGGSVGYTTAALADDAEVFGPGSVDLWMASSGTDADLQVTLTEVRPDGQEVYVQRGWQRASHRALDATQSTRLRPFHTDQERDVAPLVPGLPTPVRIELYATDHVFRQGSRIRLTIDTPTGTTGLFAFGFRRTPETHTIWHGRTLDSQLVLGIVPGGRAGAPPPACDTVLNQPCRPAIGSLPAGTLRLSAP